MSTGKDSLSHNLKDDSDLWSRKGLGPGCFRVFEVITEEPQTVRDVSRLTGLTEASARRFLNRLSENCLAGVIPGKPKRFFRVDTPLEVIEDFLGCSGYVEYTREKITNQQAANKVGWPGNYRRFETNQ